MRKTIGICQGEENNDVKEYKESNEATKMGLRHYVIEHGWRHDLRKLEEVNDITRQVKASIAS